MGENEHICRRRAGRLSGKRWGGLEAREVSTRRHIAGRAIPAAGARGRLPGTAPDLAVSLPGVDRLRDAG